MASSCPRVQRGRRDRLQPDRLEIQPGLHLYHHCLLLSRFLLTARDKRTVFGGDITAVWRRGCCGLSPYDRRGAKALGRRPTSQQWTRRRIGNSRSCRGRESLASPRPCRGERKGFTRSDGLAQHCMDSTSELRVIFLKESTHKFV